jgi:acyl-CoA thioester hydrolase
MTVSCRASVRVIYGDTDQMGVVYYANYLRYFELARSELFRSLNLSYVEFESLGFALPVIEAHVNYRAPARYEDLLDIVIRLTVLKRVSLRFEYDIVRQGDGKLLCTGYTVHCCIAKTGKPVAIPEVFRVGLAVRENSAPQREEKKSTQ